MMLAIRNGKSTSFKTTMSHEIHLSKSILTSIKDIVSQSCHLPILLLSARHLKRFTWIDHALPDMDHDIPRYFNFILSILLPLDTKPERGDMTLLPRLLSDVESDRSNDKLARDGLGLARSILAPVSAAWWIRASYCTSINNSCNKQEPNIYLFQSLFQSIALEMYTINRLFSSLDECSSQTSCCTMMINVSRSWSKTCSTYTTPYTIDWIMPSHSIEFHLILRMWIAK